MEPERGRLTGGPVDNDHLIETFIAARRLEQTENAAQRRLRNNLVRGPQCVLSECLSQWHLNPDANRSTAASPGNGKRTSTMTPRRQCGVDYHSPGPERRAVFLNPGRFPRTLDAHDDIQTTLGCCGQDPLEIRVDLLPGGFIALGAEDTPLGCLQIVVWIEHTRQ